MMMMMMTKISNRRLIMGGEKSRQNLLTRRAFNELSSSSSGNHSERSREISKQIFYFLRDRDFYAPLKASLKPLFKQSENNTQRNTPTNFVRIFSKEQNKREI